MAVLKDVRRLITVELKDIVGGEVVVRNGLLAGEIEKLNARGGMEAIKNSQMLIYPLTFLIKKWNLTDEAGNDLPITEENIGMLPSDDIGRVYEAITKSKEVDENDFLAPGDSDNGNDPSTLSA